MALPLASQPRDLLLGPDNDLVITTDLVFTTGIDAVRQSCRIAVLMFQGEWFANLLAGIPYFNGILVEHNGKRALPARAIAKARSAFRRELLAVSGVIAITKLSVTFTSDRTLHVSWQVRTALGETPVDTLNLLPSGS